MKFNLMTGLIVFAIVVVTLRLRNTLVPTLARLPLVGGLVG
jgi:hypothetical protein